MPTREELLCRRWIHAHEEDASGTSVFRPDTFPLPPSRGRRGYEFNADGAVLLISPGPTDRRETTRGTWSTLPGGGILLRVPGRPEEVIDIESLSLERLVIRKS
jgi:hypothetical protein